MTERYKKTRRRASDAVILLHSGMHYCCYGQDITIVRDALRDRVFSTSRDAEGREVYHFDRVNLSEVMCAVIRAGHRVIIVEEDMEVVADIANNDSYGGNVPSGEMEG